ncbi:MAG: FAD-binding oxidoreductase [Pseudomonadota bacterium]|nr:FAD-binding oxidoreductase [Pseudomonadota bacterium]
MTDPFPLQPALWAATAAPAVPTPPLNAAARADVCIVGAGYTGLSTALHLAQQGVDVVVLEAHEPGWGGSGRNGGQVIPGLKFDPAEFRAMFPADIAEPLIAFAGSTADTVFDLIEQHGMDVPRVRKGWIQGAHTAAGVELVRRRAAQWAQNGVAGARFLDRGQVAELIGTDKYLGGWLDPRGGGIQPLSYARGLARAAIAAGVRIHGQSPVATLQRNGDRWTLTTAQGATVDAGRVVLATNGYTGDLWPGLRRSIITPNSFQVATEPLPEAVARTILPQGHVSSDTRQLLFYFRLDHQRRLIMGGRGPFREPTSASDWSHLEAVIKTMFPAVAGTPIAYRWCGRVALTRDFLPHLHEPAEGLLVDIGCMGRGIGLQTAMGRAMARYLLDGNARSLPLPVTGIRGLPLHRLRRVYISAIVAWYRLRGGGLA